MEFQNRLLAAVSEVGRHTRLGLTAIREDIQSVGGLQAAKNRLRGIWLHNHSIRPSDYFLATRRVGRMGLSIEAIALEPSWLGLFTREEIDRAMATLSEYGFTPTLEALSAPNAIVQVPIEHEPSLAPIRLTEPRRGLSIRPLGDDFSECEVTAESAAALRKGEHPPAHPMVRAHIGECLKCRDIYSDLIAAFERFDEVSLFKWSVLLTHLQASMELGDEQLKRFMYNVPEDYEEPEQYEDQLGEQLDRSIRPICVWRAVRVSCQVGRFMSAFAATFAERGDLWLKWRKGEIQGSVSDSVRATGREQFLLALLARNLLLVRSWAAEDGGVLWMPADEDLLSVPGVVRVDSSGDLEEWEELLGKPPQDLHLEGILYLAHYAAVGQLGEVESASSEPAPGRESQQPGDRVEEMFRAILRSTAEVLEGQAEARNRQDAIIGHLEGIVLSMSTTDRYACEESLKAELPGGYEKLTQKARNYLLASEQSYRIPDFAAPGYIVHGLATAFELELRHSVMSCLFDHLKYRKVAELRVPEEWISSGRAQKRETPLWRPSAKADKCLLGEMNLILGHPHPAIEECFAQFGLVLTDIRSATESVCKYRNPATHGDHFDIGTAETIRADWFHWDNRRGGIFSVLFRNE
jgi:hypothetical protein